MRIIKSSINKRTSATSFPYKGHRIKLLNDGSGYAIYDARGELEDSGFRTAQDAKEAIDEYDSIYQDPVTSSTDDVLAGAYKQEDSIIIDAEDLRGKSREEIEEILKDAPVGSEIIHIRNTSNRFNIDTRIEKQQHYSSNYHQGFSSPHDWKTLNEFWAVGGRENPYIDKTIYEAVNGKNKYYGLTSDVLKAHGIDQPIDESTSVEASDSYNLDDETYKYVTNVDGYWIYRAIVDGKGVWRAMPQDSDESQFDSLSFPISYDQARGFEPIDEPSAITKLRKDLGKKLLPKAGQSIESTDDLSMYSDEFRHAYTLAKNDFKKDYKRAHADVQIYPSDPYLGVEEGEIVLHVTGFNPYGKKCGGMVSVDESLDSGILYQAMKETAEDLGIRKGSYDIKNSTGSTIKANKSSSVRLQMKEELMDQILSEIKSKLKEVMISTGWGFYEDEVDDYSGADIYLNNDGYFVVTVHAEVTYDGLVELMDALNPIVEKYDRDAYFDAETSGRCSAYIDPNNIPKKMYPKYDVSGSEEIEGASNEVELDPEESMIDMNIDQYIIVDSEGGWDYDSENYDWASSDGEGSDWYSETGVRLDDPVGVVEKIDELIEPHIPIEPGTYRVQGYIELYYTVSGVYENRYDYTSDDYSSDINSDLGSAEYNKKLSKIEDVKVTKI